MSAVFALPFIVLLFALLLLNLFGLPVNWIVFALICLWGSVIAEQSFGIVFFLLLAGLALVGEILEFALQAWGSKRYGGSGKGALGGMVGAIAGAVIGAPFLFGIGAFLGALAGAFCGCFLVELASRRALQHALGAAWGAMLGRFGGTVLKMACGLLMVSLVIPKIWGSA